MRSDTTANRAAESQRKCSESVQRKRQRHLITDEKDKEFDEGYRLVIRQKER